MQIVIDIPEKIEEYIKDYIPIGAGNNVFCYPDEIVRMIQNGTPIPDNATNGEWVVDRKVIDRTRQMSSYKCGDERTNTYYLDVHCSECGFKYAYTTYKEDSIPTNYCPNCGVKMKGANI